VGRGCGLKKLRRIHFIFFTVIVAASMVASAAQGQVAPGPAVRPPDLKLVTRELANGLHMVMLEDHAAPVINLQMWYHVGSKD